MQLENIKVKGLFEHFNHNVPINNDEKITIITAPNGYGKTVILKIIEQFLNGNLIYFVPLIFSEIELVFSGVSVYIIKKSRNELTIKDDKGNKFIYGDKSSVSGVVHYKDEIDNVIPWLDQVSSEEWIDHRNNEVIGFNEVLSRYGEDIPFINAKNINKTPQWLSKIFKSINVHLIVDQRLIQRNNLQNSRNENIHFRRNKSNVIDTIEKYAQELSSQIKRKSIESSEETQRLDSSFPSRLLRKHTSFKVLSVNNLKNKLEDLKNKRKKLSKYSLIASDQQHQFISLDEIKDEETKVLSLYVNDTKKKLSVYDDILQRIELFAEILNTKRLSFKKIKINRERGFFFETDKGRPLKLTQLSSGEQHEVVMLFELIFRARNNVLVLIDEPEISLHIAWQREFLSDLKRIIKLQNISVIISTHSPQIINSEWDLTVNLEGVNY